MRELESLRLDHVASPLGALLVVTDAEGRLRALDFHDHEARLRHLLRVHYGARGFSLESGRASAAVAVAIGAYFSGRLGAIESLELRTGGTEFQRRVWSALRQIPAATTTSYGRLACALGKPGAARAVGFANGANPIGIVVPCHRVIGANGDLTGYAGGIARKRWLLDHEQRCASLPSNPKEGVTA